jgi:hypothetical protein
MSTDQEGNSSMSFNFSAEKDFYVLLNNPTIQGDVYVFENSSEVQTDIQVNIFANRIQKMEQPRVRSYQVFKEPTDNESFVTGLVSPTVACP